MAINEIDGVAVMCTSELSKKLGIPVSSNLIERLGLAPKSKIRKAVYWRVCDFDLICELLIRHLNNLKSK